MTDRTKALSELIAGDADLYDVPGGAMTPEQCVMVCPQCEGEGTYADGLDDAACSTICTRCEGNGWIVDVHSYNYASAKIAGDKDSPAQSSAPTDAKIKALVSAAHLVRQWRSTIMVRFDGQMDWEQWRELNRAFDALDAAALAAFEGDV